MMRTSHDNGEFNSRFWIQLFHIMFATDLECLLGASQPTFSVSQYREEAGTARHAAGRAKLRDGLLPLACVVSSDAVSFAGDGNATSAVLCCSGVLQRLLWFFI